MIIVGCDYHPSFQQIAFVDTESGELKDRLAQEGRAMDPGAWSARPGNDPFLHFTGPGDGGIGDLSE
jgi:hypothetical protein